MPCCRWTLKAQRPPPPAYPKEIKKLGDHTRKRRLDLGLRQRDVARQIGVNKDTIYNWETNRTAPEVRFIPGIIHFLGYAPYNPGWTFGQRLRLFAQHSDCRKSSWPGGPGLTRARLRSGRGKSTSQRGRSGQLSEAFCVLLGDGNKIRIVSHRSLNFRGPENFISVLCHC